MTELEKATELWATALDEGNIEKASAAMNSMWVLFQVAITPSLNPDLKEINYIKAPVFTGNGGTYVLSLTHVTGPKINVNDDNTMTTSTVKEIL
jgi:hypothetical protein